MFFFHLQTFCLRHGSKGIHRLPHSLGTGEICSLKPVLHLIQSGECEQVPDQLSQALHLVSDTSGPLALPLTHFNHLRVGQDYGNGCLDLMPRVCDKLPLLLHALDHRPDRPPGQYAYQKQYQHQTEKSHDQGDNGKIPDGLQIIAAVHKH